MREDPVLHEALYCIRCSACLNSCANFETVGGHAFGGETYSGGIGGSWEAGTGTLSNARFSELCTACSRCVPNCPVRIDIPWLNENLRHRMNEAQGASPVKSLFGKVTGSAPEDSAAPLQKQFFGNYNAFGKWGTRLRFPGQCIAARAGRAQRDGRRIWRGSPPRPSRLSHEDVGAVVSRGEKYSTEYRTARRGDAGRRLHQLRST